MSLSKLIAAEPSQTQAYEEYYADKNKLFVDTNGSTIVEPCERSLLSFPEQRGKGEAHVSLAPDGTMFVAVAAAVGDGGSAVRSSQKLFLSRDGGHTWSRREMDLPGGQELMGFAALNDGSLLATEGGNLSGKRNCFHVNLSTDRGATWGKISTVFAHEPFENIYGMLVNQLRDGTLLMAAKWYNLQEEAPDLPDWPHHILRSSDGGKTWEGGPPADRKADQLGPGVSMPGMGGTFSCCTAGHILELDNGRLLIALRYQNAGRYAEWFRAKAEAWGGKTNNRNPDEIFKHVFLADSDDQGRTWTGLRPLVDDHGKPLLGYGECRGQLAQLPNGAIILAHDKRYPYEQIETRAKMSLDGGKTWLPRTYHLLGGNGYASSAVWQDGTVVTVAGSTKLDNKAQAIEPWQTKVIRWKPTTATSG